MGGSQDIRVTVDEKIVHVEMEILQLEGIIKDKGREKNGACIRKGKQSTVI